MTQQSIIQDCFYTPNQSAEGKAQGDITDNNLHQHWENTEESVYLKRIDFT